MSESDYAYECMRADLLGLPKPDKDSIQPRPVRSEEDEIDPIMTDGDQTKVAVEEAAALSEEQMKSARGGMEEVHNILSITQKKLNNLRCGIGNVGNSFSSSLSGSLSGFTGFIKQRVGGGEAGPSGSEIPEAADESDSGMAPTAVDPLDAMIGKAESAEMKMAAQNKQMRQMLNK